MRKKWRWLFYLAMFIAGLAAYKALDVSGQMGSPTPSNFLQICEGMDMEEVEHVLGPATSGEGWALRQWKATAVASAFGSRTSG